MKWFKKKIPTKDELYLKDIVKKYLENEKTKVIFNPLLEEYYIVDEEKQVYILIKMGLIEISSNEYLYKRNIPLKISEVFIKDTAKRMSTDLNILKKQLFHNEIDFLIKLAKD